MYEQKAKLFEAVKNKETNFLLHYQDAEKQYKNGNWKRKFTFIKKDKNIFNKIKKITYSGKYYIDEIMADGIKRKPYLDFEKYYKTKEEMDKDYKIVIKKLCSDVIKVFQKEYKKTITLNDILLLDSSGKLNKPKIFDQIEKYFKTSIHLIVSPKNKSYYYTDSRYNDSSAYHLYTSLINLEPEYTKNSQLDPLVYRKDAYLRIIGSSKQNDNRILRPINVKTFKILNLPDTEKLDYMLTYIDETKPLIKLDTPVIEQSTKAKQQTIINKPSSTECNKKLLELVRNYHPSARPSTHYGNHYNFSYINRDEPCPITGLIHKTNNFCCYETPRGLYLKCYSTRCKGRIHLGYIDEADDFVNDATQINQPYLMEYPEMENIIDEWAMKEKFTLAIKSPMATGKTTMVKHILEEYNFKKILWITHRQTLTKSTFGSFNKYGFVNYLDVDGNLFKHDKVIVQVDSLMRITDFDDFGGRIKFNKYDLVIIDEIEGCLSHFNSPFLNRPDFTARDLFDFMIRIINYSNKLLLLDADINVRTKLLVEHFGNAIVINNSYMPMEKQFDIMNDSELYHKCLYTDVKANKNICVVSMSSNAVEDISIELTKMDIKHVLHTSKTDDKLKNELEHVNDFWTKFQVVLYSPTIESGIDFNAEHFDKIYCVLADGNLTCSQRAFLQMVGRIRKIRNSKILCLYKNIPMIDGNNPITDANIYTFDDMLGYFKNYEVLNRKKILREITYREIEGDDVVQLVREHTDITLFDKISLHNEAEQLNKHHEIFVTVLKKLINKAGHKLFFSLANKKKKKDEDDETEKPTSKDAIIEKLMSVDESKFDIADLQKKQAKSNLDETEKLVLKKYFFRKTWKINKDISADEMLEYLKNYLDKEIYLYRGELILGYKKLAEFDKDTFSDGKERVRCKVVVEFVSKLISKKLTELKISDVDNIKISNEQYIKAIKDIANNSIYFKDEEKYRSLFFKKKGKINHNDKNHLIHCAKTLQKLLESYNIHLQRGNRKRNKGKQKYEYSLTVDERIMKIIENKYNKDE